MVVKVFSLLIVESVDVPPIISIELSCDCRWLDGNALTGPIPDFTGLINLKTM